MTIFAAPYETSAPPLAGRFQPVADLRAPEIKPLIHMVSTVHDTARDNQGEAHDLSIPELAPMADTAAAHMRHILRLMNRHDTTAAMDKIVRMLDRRHELPDGMEHQLRYLAETGISHLKDTGQRNEASYYRFRISLLDPMPEPPKPAFPQHELRMAPAYA